MDKHYVYLITDKDRTRFKCGYTRDLKKRMSNYLTHDPSVYVMGYFEIPDKDFEKLIHMELKRRWYKSVISDFRKKTEWFEGQLNLRELNDVIMSIKNKGYKYNEENFNKIKT